jgi:hypothetical protein
MSGFVGLQGLGLTATAPQINAAAALAAAYNNASKAQEIIKKFDYPAPVLPSNGLKYNWNFAGLPAGSTSVPNLFAPAVARRVNLHPNSEPFLNEVNVGGHVTATTDTPFTTVTSRKIFARGIRFTNDDYGYIDAAFTTPSSAYVVSVFVVMDAGDAPVHGNANDFVIRFNADYSGTATVTQIQGSLYRVSLAKTDNQGATAQLGIRASNKGRPFTITGWMVNAGTVALPYEETPYADITLTNSPIITTNGVVIGGVLSPTSTASTPLISGTPSANKSCLRIDNTGPWSMAILTRWGYGNIKMYGTAGNSNRAELGSASAVQCYIRAATESTTNTAAVNRPYPQSRDGNKWEMMAWWHGNDDKLHINEASSAFPADFVTTSQNSQLTITNYASGIGTEIAHILMWNRELTNDEWGQAWSWLISQHPHLGDDYQASKPPVVPAIPSNGLAQTPPMGFADWGYYGIYSWHITDNTDDPTGVPR